MSAKLDGPGTKVRISAAVLELSQFADRRSDSRISPIPSDTIETELRYSYPSLQTIEELHLDNSGLTWQEVSHSSSSGITQTTLRSCRSHGRSRAFDPCISVTMPSSKTWITTMPIFELHTCSRNFGF